MEAIVKLIIDLIHNPDLRNGRPLTISFCSTEIMMGVLSQLGPLETEAWTLLGERLIIIDSIRTTPPRPLEPIVSSSEDSDDWNPPVDAGNLIPDPELLLRLEEEERLAEEERRLDRIPSPDPGRIDELNERGLREHIDVFNNPFIIQAQVNLHPPAQANEDLQEIWDEEEEYDSGNDTGYYSDSDYYI